MGFPVELGYPREVAGRGRLALGHRRHEVRGGAEPQCVVAAALLPDGRRLLGGEVLPARGSRPVRRVHAGGVGQGKQARVQRPVELPRHVLGALPLGGEQVRAADVPDEQGVAGQHPVRGVRAGRLPHHDADRLGCVARGGPELQADLAELDALAVGDLAVREVQVRGLPVDDGGAGCGGQLQVPGEEVGVHVGFDDVVDAQPAGGRVVQVLLDVSPGVHHGRPPGGLVADQVRSLRQAVEVVLDESHKAIVVLQVRISEQLSGREPGGARFTGRARHDRLPGPRAGVSTVALVLALAAAGAAALGQRRTQVGTGDSGARARSVR